MTERQAFIVFAIVFMAFTIILVSGLLSLGANSGVMTLAYMLILCVGGFGAGEIVMRYHR